MKFDTAEEQAIVERLLKKSVAFADLMRESNSYYTMNPKELHLGEYNIKVVYDVQCRTFSLLVWTPSTNWVIEQSYDKAVEFEAWFDNEVKGRRWVLSEESDGSWRGSVMKSNDA